MKLAHGVSPSTPFFFVFALYTSSNQTKTKTMEEENVEGRVIEVEEDLWIYIKTRLAVFLGSLQFTYIG